MGYLSLTDADRAEMLAAIGVASVDELFEQVPSGVRFDRELDVPPALGEAELVRHLEELAAKNVPTERRAVVPRCRHLRPLRPLRRGRRALPRRVPDRVHALPAGDEPGRLQAIFEYQTVICELTGMDVSNASGYDGCTVAADACFVAKHTSDRRKDRPRRDVEPASAPDRQDVCAWFRPRSRRGPASRGHDRPGRAGLGGDGRRRGHVPAAELPRLPRARGGPRRRANGAGALSIAHVDLMSLGVLEPPGEYGCAIAIGEGQRVGSPPSTAARTTASSRRAQEFVRRMPGRIVGETVDLDGHRAFVLTLQTREQHIRREKATSNITTNQTLLALAGLVTLEWLGPQGLQDVGHTCVALTEYAKERIHLPLAFERPTFNEAREGEQRLIRRDVRRRLLATDVLLPRLQGENEGALPVQVDRLSDDSTRHASNETPDEPRRSRSAARRRAAGTPHSALPRSPSRSRTRLAPRARRAT